MITDNNKYSARKIALVNVSTERLTNLVRGDNLEIDGARIIIEHLDYYRGLYRIVTLKIGLPNVSVRQKYFASDEMINRGELALEGEPYHAISEKNQDFFRTCLRQPMEVA